MADSKHQNLPVPAVGSRVLVKTENMSCSLWPIRGNHPRQVQACESDTKNAGPHNLPDPVSLGRKAINEPTKQKMLHFTSLHKGPELEQSGACWPAEKHQVLARGNFCPELASLAACTTVFP